MTKTPSTALWRGKSMPQRFAEKYVIDAVTGCWNWTASIDKWGYGQFRSNGRWGFASHASLQIDGRPLPKGLCALHRCDNPRCVNPAHLFIGTFADNTRDMAAKGRAKFIRPPRSHAKATPQL